MARKQAETRIASPSIPLRVDASRLVRGLRARRRIKRFAAQVRKVARSMQLKGSCTTLSRYAAGCLRMPCMDITQLKAYRLRQGASIATQPALPPVFGSFP